MTQKPSITQDMIRLYDEYTHLTLDRRGFMTKLSQLAGSTAAAVAIVPLLEANQARAAIVPGDDPNIVISRLGFPVDTYYMGSYMVRPLEKEMEGLPAVLIIHENRGLNPHIEDIARRIALGGFLALAVDFLSPVGGTPQDNEDKAREMIGALDPEQTLKNAVAAVKFLKIFETETRKVGALGFCWGGGLVNRLAAASPELDAGVAYYGQTPDPTTVPNIKAKMLLHYAGLDERINAGIADYETALKDAKVDYTIHMYDGVNHAFNNDTSEARYNKEAADLSWQRTLDFFKASLM